MGVQLSTRVWMPVVASAVELSAVEAVCPVAAPEKFGVPLKVVTAAVGMVTVPVKVGEASGAAPVTWPTE